MWNFGGRRNRVSNVRNVGSLSCNLLKLVVMSFVSVVSLFMLGKWGDDQECRESVYLFK